MIFRVHFETLGGHVHCRLFTGQTPDQTFAPCGDFTVRVEEFEALREAFAKVEFVKDNDSEQAHGRATGSV